MGRAAASEAVRGDISSCRQLATLEADEHDRRLLGCHQPRRRSSVEVRGQVLRRQDLLVRHRVTFFEDLSAYRYRDVEDIELDWGWLTFRPRYERINVGWLDAPHGFEEPVQVCSPWGSGSRGRAAVWVGRGRSGRVRGTTSCGTTSCGMRSAAVWNGCARP